jgi:hypothetical protein
MIQYNQETKRLVSTFKQYRNDIDIYTEDEEKDREFYKVIFQRLLEKTDYLINDITPLGCRNNVITRCKNEPDNGRRKIFIIDGDIFIIYRAHSEKLKNLFVLDSYCIENYIVDEHSCCQYAYNLLGTDSIDAIKAKIKFEDWINSLAGPLIDLFINFSILHEIHGRFTIYNAYKYIVKGTLDFDLINKEIELVKSEILEIISDEEYNKLLSYRQKNWNKTPDNFLKIVSGKDYILPLVQIKVQELRKVKGLFSTEAFKTFLAQFCSLDRLESLKEALIHLN